jgi:hypothetical protein
MTACLRALCDAVLQVAAAAFTKGLLDLEGSSLTPILVSLVAKDASMLDAFGKVRLQNARFAQAICFVSRGLAHPLSSLLSSWLG